MITDEELLELEHLLDRLDAGEELSSVDNARFDYLSDKNNETLNALTPLFGELLDLIADQYMDWDWEEVVEEDGDSQDNEIEEG